MKQFLNLSVKGPLIAFLALAGLLNSQAASITELSTVFYGKIHGVGSTQPYLITEGDLVWTIQRADGTEITLKSQLFPLNQGEFSYRMPVPHEVMALGLDTPQRSLPLGLLGETHAHVGIAVNGQTARLVDEDLGTFQAAASKRGAVYRLDLEVEVEALDSDGDGLPDWWESKYGTDPQSNDADGDLDGDGASNLAEYLAGSDPTADGRQPKILTTDLVAYAGGRSGVLIQVVDTDSRPAQLRFELVTVPQEGELQIVGNDDVGLTEGASFTLAELQQGKILYHCPDTIGIEPEFTIRLTDENPNHEAVESTIALTVFYPEEQALALEGLEALEWAEQLGTPIDGLDADEHLRLRAYLLSRHTNTVVWDLRQAEQGGDLQVPVTEVLDPQVPEAEPVDSVVFRHVIMGTGYKDHLSGGSEDDLLMGGEGDDALQGGAGSDHFIYHSAESGQDVIGDFSLIDGDLIDLRTALSGTSRQLHDYVELRTVDGDVQLGVDVDGGHSGFEDFSIRLVGLEGDQTSLEALVKGGQLLTGGLLLKPTVSMIASSSTTSENDLKPIEIIIRREGDLSSALTVPLNVEGEAESGVDYEGVPPTVTIAPGESSASFGLTPLADQQSEESERIGIALAPSADYELGAINRVDVSIEDLRIQVSIEAAEPLADKVLNSSGVFLVKREAMLEQSVLVRLDLGGSARNGIEYVSLIRFLNFGPGETTKLLEVKPIPGAALSDGAETVDVKVVADAAYRIVGQDIARVTIVGDQITFGSWRARRFPESMSPLQDFARSDPDRVGIPMLTRYALGLPTKAAGMADLPTVTVRDRRLTLSLTRPVVEDIALIVETSSDLKSWSVQGVSVQEMSQSPTRVEEHYQSTKTIDEAADLFMRVRIEHQPSN